MAVQLPTAADVRKAREQAAKNAADRAEVARTPLLAVLGAGEAAFTAVSKAAAVAADKAADARTRAAAQAEGVQQTVVELPQRLRREDLRDDVRRAVADLQRQLEVAYAEFAKRGEATWGKIRTQPLITHRFPLEQTAAALEKARSREGIKVIVTP